MINRVMTAILVSKVILQSESPKQCQYVGIGQRCQEEHHHRSSNRQSFSSQRRGGGVTKETETALQRSNQKSTTNCNHILLLEQCIVSHCSEAGPLINLLLVVYKQAQSKHRLTMSCQPSPLENPSCGASSVTMPMRKTRSVDFFGRISARSSIHQKAFTSNGADAGTVASSFSRRAANDTYVAPQSQG
jgi:hypothetical protein